MYKVKLDEVESIKKAQKNTAYPICKILFSNKQTTRDLLKMKK